jgi:16S rRNA (adenine(1408)-N(1))-methyltransferase
LFIGVDANSKLVRDISRRSLRKPSRGGVPNALFGRLSLEEAPGDLFQLADVVTVLFPWGSLLRAVAAPEVGALRKLAALGKPGARVSIVYGYGAIDAHALGELQLPDLGEDSVLRTLEAAYAAADLQVQARYVSSKDAALVESTWAKKLAFSGRNRAFVALDGTIDLVTTHRR